MATKKRIEDEFKMRLGLRVSVVSTGSRTFKYRKYFAQIYLESRNITNDEIEVKLIKRFAIILQIITFGVALNAEFEAYALDTMLLHDE